jgi:nucleoside-diphosphate-sugar epimerase
MVRLRRRPDTAEVVAVTGAARGLGRALVERLSGRTDLGGLLGVDTVPGRVDGVVWRAGQVEDPLLATRLMGATTLVHLACEPNTPVVSGTENVLRAARELRVRRVVLCTSSEVYGVRPGNPVPLPDDWPLQADPEPGSLLAAQLAVERMAEEARRTGLDVTVLRPAALVGLPECEPAALLRLLGASRLLAVRGVEPQWQLCHVEDLVHALELAAVGGVRGVLGVGCDGALPQSVVERMSGRPRLELPASVALSTAERLHRLGLATSSARELDHVLGSVVVAGDGLRAAGWAPTWSNEGALQAHLDALDADGRSAALTAAGATVALLGTAALVRQARRRRRR